MTLSKAIKLAVSVHEGQVDKGGHPYILHPLRVMLQMSTTDEMIVAVLHDVLEDGNIELSLAPNIALALDALTRRTDESYTDYIARVATNEIARAVKLADLTDNCDLSRIPNPTQVDIERIRKYRRAIEVLNA